MKKKGKDYYPKFMLPFIISLFFILLYVMGIMFGTVYLQFTSRTEILTKYGYIKPKEEENPIKEKDKPIKEVVNVNEFQIKLPEDYSKTDWRTVLVNSNNKLSEEIATDVITMSNGEKIDSRIIEEYSELISKANSEGIYIETVSGYRSIKEQKELYENKLSTYIENGLTEEEAKVKTEEFLQTPNCSEHHTGLALDIAYQGLKDSGKDLTQELENTEEYKWLSKEASNFGFILRYPKDKEEITGIKYEPWHFRYVGKDMAEFMKRHNLSLEEVHEMYDKE